MERHVIPTRFGDAWVWGDLGRASGNRPLVLVINTAFAIAEPRTFELQGWLPEATVLNAHLPGNHCPFPVGHSIGVYAALYGDVIRGLDRPTVLVGAGVGATAALAVRAPQVRGVVLSEPLLVTGKAWPIHEAMREHLRRFLGETESQALIWNVLGVSREAVEDRDYRPLLAELAVPAWALVGEVPLGAPREITEAPSLVDEPERALLRAHPKVQLREVEGVGHNVPGRAITYVRTAARDLLQRTCGTVAPAAPLRVS